MAKRLVDILIATSGLIVASPLMLLAALLIAATEGYPVLFRARRAGLRGVPFTMLKFRTMLLEHPMTSSITANNDPRISAVGVWLRRLKLDELPQLFNVLKGEMSIVGPRPEDMAIVERHYSTIGRATLEMKPGLSSPGSIYYYATGESTLGHLSTEREYVEKLLPIKLALDLVYVQNASLLYDLRIIVRTIWIILLKAFGRKMFDDPIEMKDAQRLLRSA